MPQRNSSYPSPFCYLFNARSVNFVRQYSWYISKIGLQVPFLCPESLRSPSRAAAHPLYVSRHRTPGLVHRTRLRRYKTLSRRGFVSFSILPLNSNISTSISITLHILNLKPPCAPLSYPLLLFSALPSPTASSSAKTQCCQTPNSNAATLPSPRLITVSIVSSS